MTPRRGGTEKEMMTMKDKDFDGNKLPNVFDTTKPLTVGKMIEILEEYPMDAIVYTEPINSNLKNDTNWASTFHGSYPCKQRFSYTKAVMLIESSR
jgi:hypothetical protein